MFRTERTLINFQVATNSNLILMQLHHQTVYGVVAFWGNQCIRLNHLILYHVSVTMTDGSFKTFQVKGKLLMSFCVQSSLHSPAMKSRKDSNTTLSCYAWWRHQMEIFSLLLALCEGNPLVTGGFPSQRLVMRSFGVLFDLRLSKQLSTQSTRRSFETPSRSLWLHCYVLYNFQQYW